MATTTQVEIDSELLESLRSRHPGKHDARARNALTEQQAMQLALEAVHSSRPRS